MTSRGFSLLLGMLLCTASAAQAQYVATTQDRMTTPVPPSDKDVGRAASWFEETLRCVVDRAPTRVDNLLAAAPGSEQAIKILGSFQSRMDWCFPSLRSMSFSWDLVRGGLAEVIYHREFPGNLAGVQFPAAEAVNEWTMPRTGDGRREQLELVHSAARCLVARRPAEVAALLETQPVSDAERQAFVPVLGDLGPCLFSGVKFTVSRQSLRGLLAEAMLEYARAQRNGFAGIVTALGETQGQTSETAE